MTPDTRDVELLIGDASEPERWTLSIDLHQVLVHAAQLTVWRGGDARFAIRFDTLLDAIFLAPTSWRQWVSYVAVQTGLRINAQQGDPNALPVTPPYRVTSSAAQMLDKARSYAQQAGRPLDLPHLLAAYAHAPAGHEKDLEQAQFDRVAWANALVAEAASYPLDLPVFTALRDASFPTTSAASPDRPPGYDSQLLRVFRAAQALATPMGVRELFVAILWSAAEEAKEVLDVLIAEGPHLTPREGHPRWEPFFTALGIPAERVQEAQHASGVPSHSAEVAAVLARASALQQLRVPAEPRDLEVGDVFFALWEPQAPDLPAPVDALLDVLGLDGNKVLRRIAQVNSADQLQAVIAHLLRLRQPITPWTRPHLDNDRVHGAIPEDRDKLDVRKPAQRFAKLLAAVDVKPPIALGLFGHWGAGKSFFMGLMRQGIGGLAASGDVAYVRRPVQIEFNAWHYHDTNLWASLAVRIFEGLARALGGQTELEVERKRRELHQKVSSSAARRQEAEDLRKQALERRADKLRDLESQQAERDARQRQSAELRLRAAWRVVTQADAFKALRQAAAGLSEHFGIPAVVDSVQGVQQLRQDVAATRERALGLFSAVGHRFRDLQAGARTTGWLVLVATSALALGWGIEHVAIALKAARPDLSAAVVQVATMVSTAAAWCGRRVKQTQAALDKIAEVEAALARAETEIQVEGDPALKTLQEQIDQLDKSIHQATEEVNAAEREIAEATAEIDRINRGGLVYDFLQDRRNAASYLGQLGLISTIRQDLEQLGGLLRDFKDHSEDAIDRIVLYIDDLDRCHPDKVVEVLQAVHLLLAFDLFNVVVGVDARWLERSLRRQYVGRGQQQRADDPFSPHDYLEKIFQIPYSLAPISEEGFKRLVDGLIETRSEWTLKQRAAGSTPSPAPAPEPLAAPAPRPVNAEATPPANPTPAPAPAPASPAVPLPPAPRLYFEDHEQAFIARLHGFINRPRLAKRFINIYRLLRVRADDEQETARFNGDPNTGEYRAAATLLAVQVGHPMLAAKLMRAIEAATETPSLEDLLRYLADGPGTLGPFALTERREMSAIADKLQPLREHLPADLAPYRRWVPRVACFAFDWHVAQAPAPAPGGPR